MILNKEININFLKNNIKEFSYSLGFEKVGFARFRFFSKEIEKYKNWLANGYQASMNYLERNIDKRENIGLILSDVKSIIVFAHSYFTDVQHSKSIFKISRYAWGDDYHDILEKKIRKVANFISEQVDTFKFKIYVDTGPILEKIWAVEAGIGWQGKNSLVLSQELGSYFFIGIMLTNLDVPPDTKVVDRCGECRKCIDACPTNAIVSPKVVDSRKCISFWTIEKKIHEEIPHQLDFKGWIFGCDICQEVCPWNSKAKITKELAFYPRNGKTNLEEEDLMKLTIENFKEVFRKSPIKRAKFEGLMKNYLHLRGLNEFE
ncbi:MAG: Epoxyqueuosine (oQ) reductase QueG [Candidatus Kapaibacterium sp.]|nr:MAG: Epoxyqueuosine (oQ) reductase QueG [Candidatus Kapabacteria bacterium]